MKRILLIIGLFITLTSSAQEKYKIGPYRLDSLYGSLYSSDTSVIKPVGVGSDGKFRKLTGWPGGSGSSQWVTNGSDIYYSTGSVGIGASTTPSKALQVFTNSNGLAGAQITNSSTGSSAYSILQLQNDVASQFGLFVTGSNNSAYGGASSLNLATFGAQNIAFVTNNTVVGGFSSGGLFTLEGAIKIKGGTPGSGKVLTSDADGDATWETAGGGSSQWVTSGSDIYYDVGKVNVGGSGAPSYKFQVTHSVNGLGGMSVYNANAGSSAYSMYILGNDESTAAGGIFMNSIANTGYSGAGGMTIGTVSNRPIGFISNNTYRGGFSNAGVFNIAGLSGSGSGYVAVDNSGNLSWSAGSGGGGGFTDPLTTNGDIISRISGSTTRLAAGTAGYTLTSNGAGNNISWQAPAASSGFYTPTITNVTNVASSTAYECSYTKIGSVVHVQGYIDIDPTASSTSTEVLITLPISNSFASITEGSGTGASSTSNVVEVALLRPDVTSGNFLIKLFPASSTNKGVSFIFTYVLNAD